MNQKSHIQGVVYDVDHSDYFISLKKDTLEKIKNGEIIRSKIVYLSDKNIKQMIQRNLLITLLSEDERNKLLSDTRIIYTPEKVGLKISSRLLSTLIAEDIEDYEYRYDFAGNKIHFIINDSEGPFSDKSGFDNIFKTCEQLNKKQEVTGDLFESEYIDINKQ